MKKVIMFAIIALSMSASAFAQDSTKVTKHSKTQKHKMKTVYTCPMHPGMVMDKPGKCTECGMDLTKSKKEIMKMEVMGMYSCPMHPDVTSDKPGTCTKCSMALVEKKKTR